MSESTGLFTYFAFLLKSMYFSSCFYKPDTHPKAISPIKQYDGTRNEATLITTCILQTKARCQNLLLQWGKKGRSVLRVL